MVLLRSWGLQQSSGYCVNCVLFCICLQIAHLTFEPLPRRWSSATLSSVQDTVFFWVSTVIRFFLFTSSHLGMKVCFDFSNCFKDNSCFLFHKFIYTVSLNRFSCHYVYITLQVKSLLHISQLLEIKPDLLTFWPVITCPYICKCMRI